MSLFGGKSKQKKLTLHQQSRKSKSQINIDHAPFSKLVAPLVNEPPDDELLESFYSSSTSERKRSVVESKGKALEYQVTQI